MHRDMQSPWKYIEEGAQTHPNKKTWLQETRCNRREEEVVDKVGRLHVRLLRVVANCQRFGVGLGSV